MALGCLTRLDRIHVIQKLKNTSSFSLIIFLQIVFLQHNNMKYFICWVSINYISIFLKLLHISRDQVCYCSRKLFWGSEIVLFVLYIVCSPSPVWVFITCLKLHGLIWFSYTLFFFSAASKHLIYSWHYVQNGYLH